MPYGLGVDLGTTYTAAAVGRGDLTDVIGLGDRSPEVPSVVYLRDDGELLVGEHALHRGVGEPERLAREFKRRLGDPTPVVLAGRPFAPPVLMARLLQWVVAEAVARHDGPPDRLVLTFPATWGPHRQDTLLQAAALAEVGPVETCPEPVAAALHFAAAERVPLGGTVAVYDLGGGTFDAAVLRHSEVGFELLGSAAGLEHVGGVDFDQVVFDHVTSALVDELVDLDPDDPEVTEGLVRLRRECAEAKEHLSGDTEATVRVVLPGVQRRVRLTRPEFEDLVRPLIGETVGCLRRTLESADLAPEDLAAVVLVGGSARVPLVSEMLGQDLGRPVTLSPSPKHAVALGAALLAGRPTPRSRAGVPAAPSTASAPVEGERPQREQRPDPQLVGPPDADLPHADPQRSRGGSSEPARVAPAPSGSTRRPRHERVATASPWRLPTAVAGMALAAVALGTWGQRSVVPEEGDIVPVDLDGNAVVMTSGVEPGQSLRLHPFGPSVSVEEERTGVLVADLQNAAAFAAGPLPAVVDDRAVFLQPEERSRQVPAGLTAGLVLFVLAYAESFLRRVRRRRRARPADVAGMALVGLLGGVAILVVGWLLGPGWALARLVVGHDRSLLLCAAVLCLSAAVGAGLVPLAARRGARRRPTA